MKRALFQELLDLNRAFNEVLGGLERIEKVRHFQNDMIRRARADVEIARDPGPFGSQNNAQRCS
ncbi:MAG: hypothetical protein WB630_18915 [Candidatus Acidiferrales bacterium]